VGPGHLLSSADDRLGEARRTSLKLTEDPVDRPRMSSVGGVPVDHELTRVAALAPYGIMDTEPEPMFDDLVRLAARICGVPMSGLSLVGTDRVWFKAQIGLGLVETPCDMSICTWAVQADDDVFVVEDTQVDERFRHNPMVADRGIRFYAGAPVHSSEGISVGAVCVMGQHPLRQGSHHHAQPGRQPRAYHRGGGHRD
jgi:GAF domain-containing protein